MSIPFYSNVNMNHNTLDNYNRKIYHLTRPNVATTNFTLTEAFTEEMILGESNRFFVMTSMTISNLTSFSITIPEIYSKAISIHSNTTGSFALGGLRSNYVYEIAYNPSYPSSATIVNVIEATSSLKGVVKLNDTLTSTATDAALTANQGNVLYNMINDLPKNDYKTDEIIPIGTWFDKTLYRTVQVATLNMNMQEDNTITLDMLTTGTSIPIHIYGYTYLTAANKVIYFDNHKNTAGTTVGIYIAEYHPDTRVLDYYVAPNTASEIRSEGGDTKLYFIIEYFENE